MASNKQIVKCSKCLKIVYDNTNSICCDDCQNWFHQRCSGLKLKEISIYAKNKDLIFYCEYCLKYKCAFCTDPVFDHQNAISCDSCFDWFHLRCSKLGLEQYHILSKSSETWLCNNCHTFPFQSVDNTVFLETLDNAYNKLDSYVDEVLNNHNNFSNTCSVCLRKTISMKKIIL